MISTVTITMLNLPKTSEFIQQMAATQPPAFRQQAMTHSLQTLYSKTVVYISADTKVLLQTSTQPLKMPELSLILTEKMV